MARPKIEIDPQELEKLVILGFCPEEIEYFFGVKIPQSVLKDLYFKHYVSYENYLEKYTKRIYRNKKYTKIKSKLKATLKAHIADMIMQNLPPVESLVGYKIEVLINHLESLFSKDMSWEDRSHWHIDHIKPKSLFKLNEIKECFSLSNLRPIPKSENLEKGVKWQG